jgi:hypothetical protein
VPAVSDSEVRELPTSGDHSAVRLAMAQLCDDEAVIGDYSVRR